MAARQLSRWHVASRVLAALIPGFILTNTVGIFLSMLLPGDKLLRVGWTTLFSYAAYAAIIVWVFAEKRLRVVWIGLGSAIAVTGLGSYGLYLLEAAP